MIATRFPFVATDHVKMRAMTRKRPAIVESPDNFNIGFFYKIEQQRQIDNPQMQIM
jgi:hypothetical protein